MATINNVVVPNFAGATTTSTPPLVFNTIWKLTRAMKKAGWKYLASGNGTVKDTTALPANDLWGTGTTSNPGAAAASITAVSRGRATVTGLSGIVSTDKGKFLTIAGSGSSNNGQHQIEEIVSSTSVKIDARTIAITAPDANNGALTWTILDPLGTTYPSSLDSVQAWWSARGPSVLRIPITAAPAVGSGGFTFLRGENIVQATTGFEGEIIGYVFDSGTGYLNVVPRLRGTGAGVYGLTTANAFTGASSGATVTQNGTALEYRYEVTIWKSTTTGTGVIYMTQAEPVAEGATDLFSALSTSAGCTATVAPGGGGTGNSFPTKGWTMFGSGTTIAGAVNWSGTSNTNSAPFGNSQVIAVDLIEEQGHSADGSWAWLLSSFGTVGPTGGGMKIISFQRIDDGEDGDLSPYVSFHSSEVKTLFTANRTSAGTTDTANSLYTCDTLSLSSIEASAALRTYCEGWYRRGLTNERFQEFELAALRTAQSGTGFFVALNPGQGELVASAPVATVPREPVWVLASGTGFKMRKGTFRWIYCVGPGGAIGRFYDNKQWVQVATTAGAMVIGPWDGTTTMLVS